MKISDLGIIFLQDREGYKEVAYKDSAGIWTIGYGTTWIDKRRVKMNDFCDRNQAFIWLMDDIELTEKAIDNFVKGKINQNQYDSLVSLTYNIGINGFGGSTLLKTINRNARVYKDLFTRWNKITLPNGKKVVSKGLTNRRELEYEFYIKD